MKSKPFLSFNIFLKAGLCLLFAGGLFALFGESLAQTGSQQQSQQAPVFQGPKPPRRVGNVALRYEVDAKRTGTDMNSEDALPRSREFIRIDSSYYIGWMYEGAYKFNHAADYLGYRNAAAPLERALRQIERDYRPELSTRTNNIFEFINIYPKQIDYAIIVNYLNQCYLNTEQPDKTYALLRRYANWNFQREFFDTYNYMMWVTHRNRFYTSSKYPFLKNSIDENEALANRYLDTSMIRLRRNAKLNATIFQKGYDDNDYLGVYHYRSMIYAYSLKVNSAEYYFNKLRNTPLFPHNNYATFKTTIGDFQKAEEEYKLASQVDPADKRLQEWAYYTSILQVYKGQPKTGELLMKDMIRSAGSTPGFGWYNIALARCLFYDGQIAESERHAARAAAFKELHIGTTLGQSHYDFSIQLNKLMTKESEYEMKRFEHRNWWYNPKVLGSMAQLSAERYMQSFLIINQFAQNPERDQVIYRLFSTESTVGWDEVFQLVKNFSTSFFVRRFNESAQKDVRPAIRKYFHLMVARLHIKEGDYDLAEPILKELIREKTDPKYEKLFLARCYQGLAECADGRDKPEDRDRYLYQLYQTYPQLIPFSGLAMPMHLEISGEVDQALVDRLKDCNIRFDAAGAWNPRVRLIFRRKGNSRSVEYSVVDAAGRSVVTQQTYGYSDSKVGGASLAYRIFGVGGTPR
jgi:hypothetical protein